jgi:transcriptional regulator with XRE-family HTH domain
MAKSASVFFRQRILQLRKAKGWTQEQAAEKCGIGYKLYQLYEIGKKPNPGLNSIEKICDGYGISLSEFFRGI